MKLNAQQSVQIFGWWDQPREYLSWEDVKTKSLSWRYLRLSMHFTPQELHLLQPDKEEWLKRGQLTLHDVSDMTVFPINPFTDMRADIAEVWNMRWHPELLAGMNVTYEQLKEHGMSDGIMLQFGFSLSAWQRLGLKSKHATANLASVFGLSEAELKKILEEHRMVHKVSNHSACT